MLRNYLLTAFRYLRKQPTYSLINIIGFSIALIPIALAVLFIEYEFSYDRYIKNNDRIYRVVHEQHQNGQIISSGIVPNPLAGAMKAGFPEIEYAGRIINSEETVSVNGGFFNEKNVLYADPDIFKIFPFEFVSGSQAADPYSIMCSERIAKKYFGDIDAVGKRIQVGSRTVFTIAGVFKNMPANTHFTADLILHASLLSASGTIKQITKDDVDWGTSIFFAYFLLRKNTDIKDLEKKIPQFLSDCSGNDCFNKSRIHFQPLKDIHLNSGLSHELGINGNISTNYLFIVLGLILLTIAVINYVNLATSRYTRRLKEIGVRKMIGAKHTQLFLQIIFETTSITLVSFIITLVLVSLIMPYFNQFVGREINFTFLTDINLLAIMILLIIFISLSSGFYPALLLSTANPISFFRRMDLTGGSLKFRNILIVFQFFMAIVIVFFSFVIKEQLNFISNKDLGFEKNDILIVNISGQTMHQIETLKYQLYQNPDIISVSSSINLPNATACGGEVNWPGKPVDVNFKIDYNCIDEEFINLYRMRIIEGRNFSDEYPSDEINSVIINETAAKHIGWDNPLGKIIYYTSPYGTSARHVIGVVKDFHMRSIHQKITPFFFVIDNNSKHYYLSIKFISGTLQDNLTFVKEKTALFQPGIPFEYNIFDDMLRATYSPEYKLQSVFITFAFFTLFIACMGLFGLISFNTEIRKKEVGIRKILGASVAGITYRFLREIILLISISLIISIPPVYFISNNWLAQFAYKTKINMITILAIGISIVLIAIIIVALKIVQLAKTNPVESLRYE